MGDNDQLMGLEDEVIDPDAVDSIPEDAVIEFVKPGEEEVTPAEGDSGDSGGNVPDVEAIRELQIQQLREERDHWRTTHDSLTSKVSDKVRASEERNRQLEAELQQLRGGGEYTPQSPAPQGVATPPHDPRLDALTDDMEARRQSDAERTYHAAVADFSAKFPKLEQELVTGITAHLEANAAHIKAAVASSDTARVRMLTTSLLTEGLMNSMQGRRTDNMNRQQEQQKKVQSQKTLATPPQATKTRATPRGPLTPEDIQRMPPEQQKKALDAFFRSQGRKGF